ncbi:hypothetical protein [Paracoccus mutanolyticus]|uniref:hypothetical protein n=1 Tax=Paracoccus mutanolyticus TaxID=1499308 RepID=UPI001CB91F3D|nr:hypothetical protein [Paracoccus mutanolyticus]
MLEGDVQCMGRMIHGAPTDPVSCAWFGATRGKFRMTYPFDEHSVVVVRATASRQMARSPRALRAWMTAR